MLRLVGSTCGLFVEAVVFDAAGPPLALGCAVIGMVLAAVGWWGDFHRLIDGIIGLDLAGADDAWQPHTETD